MTNLLSNTRSLLDRLPARGGEGEGDEGVDRVCGRTAGARESSETGIRLLHGSWRTKCTRSTVTVRFCFSAPPTLESPKHLQPAGGASSLTLH